MIGSAVTNGRAKLKSYVYFGKVDDGTWFEAGSKSFVLRNPRLYPVAEKFVALLDQGYAIPAIMAQAPAAVRPVFETLLTSLADNDMLQQLEDAHPWPRSLRQPRAADDLTVMLEDRLGGAALTAALARWRAARVTVIGSGHALKAAAGAIAAAGCGELCVSIEPVAGPLAAGEIEAFVAAKAAVTSLRFDVPELAMGDIGTRDLVLYVGDDGDVQTIRRLIVAGRDGASAAIIAGVFAGHACVARATAARPDFDDLLHWLPAADGAAPSHSPTSYAVLGCVAAQASIDEFFGFDADTRQGQVTVVSPDLTVERHPLVPRPTSSEPVLPFSYVARHQLPDERPLETFEIVKLALDPWFDAMFGPFRAADDMGLRQMPLLQYPIEVRTGRGKTAIAIGWGLDLGEAGMRAIDAALAHLAAPLTPAGSVFAVGLDAAQWQRRARAGAIIAGGALRINGSSSWLPLDELDDGRVRLLQRLLRYHTAAPVRVRLFWSRFSAAYGVEIWLGDGVASTAIADDVATAVVEALGRACSDFQLADAVGPGFWLSQRPAFGVDIAAAPDADWRAAIDAVGEPFAVDFHAITALGLPSSLSCGYAVVQPVAY